MSEVPPTRDEGSKARGRVASTPTVNNVVKEIAVRVLECSVMLHTSADESETISRLRTTMARLGVAAFAAGHMLSFRAGLHSYSQCDRHLPGTWRDAARICVYPHGARQRGRRPGARIRVSPARQREPSACLWVPETGCDRVRVAQHEGSLSSPPFAARSGREEKRRDSARGFACSAPYSSGRAPDDDKEIAAWSPAPFTLPQPLRASQPVAAS
jgi:hypothetical protein